MKTLFAKIALALALMLQATPAPGKLPADGKEIIPTDLLQDGAITLPKLADGISPAFIPVFAGEFTWSGSGASCAETVTGALATDIVLASIQSVPAQAAYLASVAVTENTVTATLSAANTGNDAVIAYMVLRAAS